MSSPFQKSSPDSLMYYTFLLSLFLIALRPVDDFDTFWQLQSGKWIWQNKQFLYADTFSLAKDAFRFEHCWLSDLIFYAFFSLGGFVLLGLLKTAVITLCGILLIFRATGNRATIALSIPLIMLCLIASSPSWVERPQLWTFLLSLVFLTILYAGREAGIRAWLWLPLLMLLWANLHAGSVFGLVLVSLFWMGEAIRSMFRKTSVRCVLQLLIVCLATLGATFINPYGKLVPGQLLAHMRLNAGQTASGSVITEWLMPSPGQMWFFIAIFTLWGIFLLLRYRSVDPAELLMFLAFAWMGYKQLRHTAFVPLLAAFFLPSTVSAVFSDFLPSVSRFLQKRSCSVIGVALCAVPLVISVSEEKLGVGIKPNQFPEKAATFILDKKLPANIYNFYDWGGYLMWRLYPDYPVFVDGRNTSMEHLEASNRIDSGSSGWKDDLARFAVNTVVTRTCYEDTGGPIRLVENLAVMPDWALVYADEAGVVYLRRSAGSAAQLQGLELDPREVWNSMYREASRLYKEDSGRMRALLSLARSSVRLGKRSEAVSRYSEYLARVPGDSESVTMLQLLATMPEQ